jgi:PAS domain S-box-containing protein
MLWQFLRRFSIFGPSEEDIARTGRVVSQLLVGFGFLVMIPLAFAIWNKLWISAGALAGAEILFLFGIGLNGYGRLKGAIVSLLLAFLTVAVVLTNHRDGAHQALWVYPCALAIAGLFLNRRTFITTAMALGGTIMLAIIASNNGWGGVPHSPYTPLPDLGDILFYLAATAVVIGLLGQHFRESLERERAQKRELLESAERLNALDNATFEGINLTLDGVIIEANNQLAEMLGRNGSELIGCPAVDFIAPESRAAAARGIRELRTDPYECYAIRKDGSKILVEINARIANYRGQQVRVAAVRDITEQRRTTNLLLESARFQQAILDSLSTRIAVVDETGTILAVNRAWKDFASENSPSPERVNEGVNYLAVCAAAQGVGAEFGRQFADGIQKVLSGELPMYEMEHPCHGATAKLCFHGRVTPFPGSGPRRAVIAYEDITERKPMPKDLEALSNVVERQKAGEQLRLSKLRYRTLFELAQDAIFIISCGKVIDFNPHALALYGCTKQQFLEHLPLNLSPSKQPNGRLSDEISRQYVEASLAGTPQHFEWVHQRPDGSQFDADIVMNAFPLGDTSAIMAIVRDITERKRGERSLQQSRAELRELYTRLNTLREDERKQFSLEIHDHAGQLITALKFDISSANHNAGTLPDSKAKEVVMAKLASAKNFLNEVHVALVKMATSLRPAALNAGLLLALKTEIAVFAEGSRWDYRLDLPEHEMPLSDHAATMLFRIFQESITNIARHANATQVLVRMKVDRGNLVLQIEDNGKGVPQEKLVGSLGLLGMQERAGSLGGQLTIAGCNKRGTNVTVSIPYAENHR